MIISNFEGIDQHSAMFASVDEFRVNVLGILINDQVSTLRRSLSQCEYISRFVMKKNLGFQDVETSDQRWTSKSFSSVIDLSKVMKFSLCSGYSLRLNRIKYD